MAASNVQDLSDVRELKQAHLPRSGQKFLTLFELNANWQKMAALSPQCEIGLPVAPASIAAPNTGRCDQFGTHSRREPLHEAFIA